MLEFRDILPEMDQLAKETARRSQVKASQLYIAIEHARMANDTWSEQLRRIWSAKTPWLTALPLSELSPASAAISPNTTPEQYTVIACDGSQIPLDRNEIAPCYLLNIGRVAIHYGTRERCLLDSQAKLYYREEDLLANGRDQEEGSNATQSYIDEKTLATRRLLSELDALADLIEQCAGRKNVVAYVDGTLILWAQEAEAKEQKTEALQRFLQVMERAKACHTPLLGYLSRPASREVIGGLRVSLCPFESVNCTQDYHAAEPTLPCSGLNRITDADLFSEILEPGQRSGLYLTASHVLRSYKPDDQKIAFTYLNTGSEIARIEMPRWVADDESLLNLCHSVTLDQVRKGAGYPICLAEAHEQAVVRGPERDAFFRLLENSLVYNNSQVSRSAKAVSKRRRIV